MRGFQSNFTFLLLFSERTLETVVFRLAITGQVDQAVSKNIPRQWKYHQF